VNKALRALFSILVFFLIDVCLLKIKVTLTLHLAFIWGRESEKQEGKEESQGDPSKISCYESSIMMEEFTRFSI